MLDRIRQQSLGTFDLGAEPDISSHHSLFENLMKGMGFIKEELKKPMVFLGMEFKEVWKKKPWWWSQRN